MLIFHCFSHDSSKITSIFAKMLQPQQLEHIKYISFDSRTRSVNETIQTAPTNYFRE